MKIYDCFTFFNELDLLEIRLAELYDHVDYFVLVEATKTYSGEPKPLYYQKNKARFKRWEKKIIHVVADLPDLNLLDRAVIGLSKMGPLFRLTAKLTVFRFGRWKLEYELRDRILDGLKDAAPDDLIIVSCIDEIPKGTAIPRAAKIAKQGHVVALRQDMYFYYLNGLSNHPWDLLKMCRFDVLIKERRGSPQYLRTPIYTIIRARLGGKGEVLKYVNDGGWHFSYMGGPSKVIVKKKTGTGSEISTGKDVAKDQVLSDIEQGIFRYKDIIWHIKYHKPDSSLPRWVLEHQKEFAHMIKPVNVRNGHRAKKRPVA